MTENLFTNVEINDGTVVLYLGKEHLKCSDEGLKALLNDMNNDIQQLRKQLQNVSTKRILQLIDDKIDENAPLTNIDSYYKIKILNELKEQIKNEVIKK